MKHRNLGKRKILIKEKGIARLQYCLDSPMHFTLCAGKENSKFSYKGT